MRMPYPKQISVPIHYKPTSELSHSQLLELRELRLPALEDLSWEDVASSSCTTLRHYAKVYEARAEGLRMPRSRPETDIFFTALLHARRNATHATAAAMKECMKQNDEPNVHQDVLGLIMERDFAFRCAERYGTDELGCVARFISGKAVKWTDESTVMNAVGIAEELAELALNKIKQSKGEREMVTEMEGVMETLQLAEPWKGWCGWKGGIHS